MEREKSESKYERVRRIGIGSYGVVFKCINRHNGQIVAIKRYSENDSDPNIRKIAMREVRMLRQLKHPNLINLIEVFRRKRRLHLVFDYCELTVLDVIERYGSSCPPNLIKKIVRQLVTAINYCHSHNCIHRDIKPENILINQAEVVKLCDFGFARNITNSKQSLFGASSRLSSHNNGRDITSSSAGGVIDVETENSRITESKERPAFTDYVATRWYRAPELLVGDIYYDVKIDIWAIGCVGAELMSGEPVWPGKTDLDQLVRIKRSLGQMTAHQMHTLITQRIYEQENVDALLKQTIPNVNESLERKIPSKNSGHHGLDFIASCLRMDPMKRPTSEELTRHKYIQTSKVSQPTKDGLVAIDSNANTGRLSPAIKLKPLASSEKHLTAVNINRVGVGKSNSQTVLSNIMTTNSNNINSTIGSDDKNQSGELRMADKALNPPAENVKKRAVSQSRVGIASQSDNSIIRSENREVDERFLNSSDDNFLKKTDHKKKSLVPILVRNRKQSNGTEFNIKPIDQTNRTRESHNKSTENHDYSPDGSPQVRMKLNSKYSRKTSLIDNPKDKTLITTFGSSSSSSYSESQIKPKNSMSKIHQNSWMRENQQMSENRESVKTQLRLGNQNIKQRVRL